MWQIIHKNHSKCPEALDLHKVHLGQNKALLFIVGPDLKKDKKTP